MLPCNTILKFRDLFWNESLRNTIWKFCSTLCTERQSEKKVNENEANRKWWFTHNDLGGRELDRKYKKSLKALFKGEEFGGKWRKTKGTKKGTINQRNRKGKTCKVLNTLLVHRKKQSCILLFVSLNICWNIIRNQSKKWISWLSINLSLSKGCVCVCMRIKTYNLGLELHILMDIVINKSRPISINSSDGRREVGSAKEQITTKLTPQATHCILFAKSPSP